MVTASRRSARQVWKAAPQAGFTLLEMIVVIAIIGILAAIVMPQLKNVPRRAAETALKTDLRAFREAIDQYYADKGVYPPSLDDLVKEKYLRSIPVDPITKSNQTWVVVYEEASSDGGDQTGSYGDQQPGIIDVHSGSNSKSLDGTLYKDW